MKRVVAFGTFDILHPGHIAFLEAARRLGTNLTVVVARDATVRREKGRLPVFNERDRLRVVASLKSVDHATLGDRPDSWRILRRIRPDVIAVGYDQPTDHPSLGLASVSSHSSRPRIVRLPRFGSYKSSTLSSSLRGA